MHYFILTKILRCIPAILLAGAVWLGRPSDGASAAGMFQISAASHATADRIGTASGQDRLHAAAYGRIAEFRMIELLVVACRGENCREVSLLYDAYHVSLMTCMVMGQHEAAKWQSSNPAWQIRRWSCRIARPSEKTI